MTQSSEAPGDGYRALVTNFPNGVIVLFDSELSYQIVGPEILPFSGREASAMVGKTIYELFPDDTASMLEPQLQATIGGKSCSFDTHYEGQIHHIETKPVQIEGDSYGVLITQDVTEERQTERELTEKNKRLETFASIVSHDLRNPLNVAQGRLKLAREECETDHHDPIESALDRIERIIQDVLWLAREGKDLGSVEPVDFAEATESAWTMVSERSEDAELRIAGGESQFPTITADYDRLRQLLENLLRNAIEHGGDGVIVTVGALADGFYVEDTGPGIPEKHRDAVFEAGYSTADEGTGFGLNIVKQVADAHGWNMRITDGSDGGARFEFTDVEFPKG